MLACGQLGVPVLIPELVLWEAEAISLQKTAESIKSADAAFQRAAARISSFELSGHTWPDRQSRKKAYGTTVAELASEWKWSVAPLPKVSLAEAVLRSVHHDAPFADADTGFRDSLIVWSLLEQLQSGNVLGLIASDNAFFEARIKRASTVGGVSLRIFRTPEEAWDTTVRMVRASSTKEVLAYWEQENNRLVAALEADRERLEEFVREHLQIPERPSGVAGSITAVRAIRVMGIQGAHVTFGAGKSDNDHAHVEVTLKIEVMLTSYPATRPRLMRVGQTADDVSSVEDMTPSTAVVEIDGVATVSMRLSTWAEDPHATLRIHYAAVEFGTPAEQLARRMALLELIGKK